MRSLDITENDKILIIAPHPDDECIGPGGVLLRYPVQCDVVVLTDGRQGQGDIPPQEVKEIRKREFINEMNQLGVHSYRMLDIEDGTLLSHTDCLYNIRIQDYNIIFVTSIQDEHPDHKAAYLCLGEASKKISGEVMPRCFVYEIHTPLLQPTHFLDISGIMRKKTDLIRLHKSQLKELPYDCLAEQNAAYRATLFRMPEKKIEVYEEVRFSDDGSDAVLETEHMLQKERIMGWTLKRWVYRLLEGKDISSFLSSIGIREVYIYGYGELGKLLVKELEKEMVVVKAVIDRRAEQFENESIRVIHLEEAIDHMPVIVTAIYEYAEIEQNLKQCGFEQIYSLRSLLEIV